MPIPPLGSAHQSGSSNGPDIVPPVESSPCLSAIIERSSSYAGIGSRTTPSVILSLMTRIAMGLSKCGIILRSGGAPGADWAFERGCDLVGGKKEIFLPWGKFNGHPSLLFPPSKEAESLAALYHPNWPACTLAARKLHARNCQQIGGEILDDPVGFVVFWAPESDGVVSGGTAMGVYLARHHSIPTFNLAVKNIREQWIAHIEGWPIGPL